MRKFNKNDVPSARAAVLPIFLKRKAAKIVVDAELDDPTTASPASRQPASRPKRKSTIHKSLTE